MAVTLKVRTNITTPINHFKFDLNLSKIFLEPCCLCKIKRETKKIDGGLTLLDPKLFYDLERNKTIRFRKSTDWPDGKLNYKLKSLLETNSIENVVIPGKFLIL